MTILTVQPNAAAGKDNLIISSSGDTNYGTYAGVQVGDTNEAASDARRSLIKFDLSPIPPDAIVASVTLSLYELAAGDTVGMGSWAVNLHRLLRDWVELQSTWNSWKTGNSWTVAGAGSDGNDRDADVSATLTLDGAAAEAFLDWTGATLIDDVQKFVDGTYPNYGWLIQAPDAERPGVSAMVYNEWISSDHATSGWHPKLVVEYGVPAGGYAGIF